LSRLLPLPRHCEPLCLCGGRYSSRGRPISPAPSRVQSGYTEYADDEPQYLADCRRKVEHGDKGDRDESCRGPVRQRTGVPSAFDPSELKFCTGRDVDDHTDDAQRVKDRRRSLAGMRPRRRTGCQHGQPARPRTAQLVAGTT